MLRGFLEHCAVAERQVRVEPAGLMNQRTVWTLAAGIARSLLTTDRTGTPRPIESTIIGKFHEHEEGR